jgi:hypothetical protein
MAVEGVGVEAIDGSEVVSAAGIVAGADPAETPSALAVWGTAGDVSLAVMDAAFDGAPLVSTGAAVATAVDDFTGATFAA